MIRAKSTGIFVMYARTYSRRSGRMARAVPVILRWQTPFHEWQQKLASTRSLSRYGCTVLCRSRAEFGTELTVVDVKRHKRARARIVYRELTGSSAQVTLALEFKHSSNFWGIEFPPATSADVME